MMMMRFRCVSAYSLLLLLLVAASATDADVRDDSKLWTVIVDAGSTGSRLFSYHIGDPSLSEYSGGVGVRRGGKVKPGLATLAGDPDAACAQLLELFIKGADLVPLEQRRFTRAIVRGTGGLRDELSEPVLTAFLEALYSRLSEHALFPFSLSRDDVGIVTGRDESFYAFASANFLHGRVDHLLRRQQDSLVGSLDLGGSSTQITYAYEEHCEEMTCTERKSEVGREDLYARSYAGFGAQAVRERAEALGGGAETCFHVGHGNGTGDFLGCIATIRRALFGDERAVECSAASTPAAKRLSCALSSGGVSALPNATRFLAMCNYFYVADALRVLAEDSAHKQLVELAWPTPPLQALSGLAEQFCSLPWETVWAEKRSLHPYTPNSQLATRCFEAAYVLVLLQDAFALGDQRVTFLLDAKGGAEVEWTLGFFLAEVAHSRHLLPNATSIS